MQEAKTLQQAVERIARQDGVFFSDRFLLPRPLLRAILSDTRSVLLIDEVDKSDAEFEAFLLEVLSDWSANPRPVDPKTIDWRAVKRGEIEPRVRQRPSRTNASRERPAGISVVAEVSGAAGVVCVSPPTPR